MKKHKQEIAETQIGTISNASRKGGYFVQEGAVAKQKGEDMLISIENLNTALSGDKVEVDIHKAKVVRVLSRARTKFSGTVMDDHDYFWVKPTDTKLHADILITPSTYKSEPRFALGDKVAVEITDWKTFEGKVIKVIGQAGLHETEIQTILFDGGIEYDFPPEVEKEAAEATHRTSMEEEAKKRRDFREVLTFTIDPYDAKDFDDAISFKRLQNGNVEVGVHIADVSHFVRPHGALDQEAIKRGTSVYLVDRTIPMLPEALANNACSLIPNEDRLTFGAVFEIDSAAKVKNVWFGKTIIHSNKRFTYEEAQDVIGQGNGPHADELQTLNRLAKIMRAGRMKRGSLELDTIEVKFRLDANGRPVEIMRRVSSDSHKLIEEYMLLANRYVAEHIFKRGKGNGGEDAKGDSIFVYRIHDTPNKMKISELRKFLKNLGYKSKEGKGAMATDEIRDLLKESVGRPEENLVKTSVLRSFAKAIYSTQNIGHFSLAFESYTHFTSPIRRYPDMMVHRLLDDYLHGKKPSPTLRAEYERLCASASAAEKKAAEAERASIKYKQMEYLEERIGEEYDGVITGATEWGIYVELAENLCEGMVALRNMKDDYYFFDEKNYCLVGRKHHKKYRLGDKVRVKIAGVSVERRQADFEMV